MAKDNENNENNLVDVDNNAEVVLSKEEESQLLKVRRDKLKELQDKGKDPFVQVKYDISAKTVEIKENFEEFEGKEVSLAGRMMSRRVMGKASFCDVKDMNGRIQSYVARDKIGEENYADFKHYDIGDIVGIKGEVFKTKMGEISIKVSSITLLSKSLQILPEKFHGLKDQETRFRKRYLDLIVNDDVRENFVKRSNIIRSIRNYLESVGFMEVETPVLQTIPGGASARPFITKHNTLNMEMYMRIALELPLKRLIIGGFDKVFEIGRVFRNEGMSTRHNPEFTMIELYEAYTDYNGMMEITENIIKAAADSIGSQVVKFGDHEIDFSKPFKRITMIDAVKEHSGVDFDAIYKAENSLEEAKKVAKEHHVQVEKHHLTGDILNLFFEEFVESNLIQPTFILDYPIEISHLTKKKPDNPLLTERFELFVVGGELANAYSELNDPIDQLERFKHQEALRGAGDEEANMTDDDFILAMEYGMPPTGGLGIGIDRLVMLLTGTSSIRDVLFFPTMKPIDQ